MSDNSLEIVSVVVEKVTKDFPLLIVPSALFSDYCYFYRDTRQEPLRRRETTNNNLDNNYPQRQNLRNKVLNHPSLSRIELHIGF